jgi:hypothetical protein
MVQGVVYRFWLTVLFAITKLVYTLLFYSYTGCQSYDFIPVSVYAFTFIPKIVVIPKSLS